MTPALGSLGLPEIVAGLLVLGLNAYALMGGADYGGGVWDLLATGPRREEQRALIARAIGPIWEANHVWLIVAIVVLFTAFPAAFATIAIVLHIPLELMLIGIVLRGASFMFRSYGTWDDATQRRWRRTFALASTITPIFLGIVIGALASGAVGARTARGGEIRMPMGSFYDVFVASWAAPFPVAVGLLALTLFAFLAAVYLTLAARDDALREDFRRRALGAAVAVFVAAFGAFAVAYWRVPGMRSGLTATAWALPLQLGTALAASTAIVALWRRRWQLARLAAAAQVSLILWGWALAQYPFLIPQSLAIRDAAAPSPTLSVLLGTLIVGGAILVPSLVHLFRTFASAADARW